MQARDGQGFLQQLRAFGVVPRTHPHRPESLETGGNVQVLGGQRGAPQPHRLAYQRLRMGCVALRVECPAQQVQTLCDRGRGRFGHALAQLQRRPRVLLGVVVEAQFVIRAGDRHADRSLNLWLVPGGAGLQLVGGGIHDLADGDVRIALFARAVGLGQHVVDQPVGRRGDGGLLTRCLRRRVRALFAGFGRRAPLLGHLAGLVGMPALDNRAAPEGQRRGQARENDHREAGRDGGLPAVAPQVLAQHVGRALAAGLDGFAGQIVRQIAPQRVRGLVAPLRVFGQTPQDDRLDVVIDPAGARAIRDALRAEARRLGVLDALEHLRHRSLCAVREAPGEHLVENHTERVHVRAQVDPPRITGRLLGAGPGQRTQKLSGLGHREGGIRSAAAFQFDFGQAEVQDARLALLVHADVAGLEIAVGDSAQMRGMHGRTQLDAQSQGLLQRVGPMCHPRVERLSPHVVHHEIVMPRDLSAVVDRDDVRVSELPQHLDFPVEARLFRR